MRLYVPSVLAPNVTLELPRDSAHRLRDVMRLQANDSLCVFDGTGGEYQARVKVMSRAAVLIEIGAWQAVSRESPLVITLAQGISRAERMDYTIQKAVELGVSRIVPLALARSQVKLDAEREAKRLAHWRGIIEHACEQSGRDRVPILDTVQSLAEFSARDHAELRLTLSPTASATLPELQPLPATISLVIGPEGGLAPQEFTALDTAGYRAVRLGPRVLRTETAALVALTALQSLGGDLT